MPRYFFDVLDDVVAIDDEGTEFADLAAAIDYARDEVCILAGESVTVRGVLVLNDTLRVRDQAGATLATIRFGDVVEVVEGPVRVIPLTLPPL